MNKDKLRCSDRIITKLLEKHAVTFDEIWECFLNRQGGFLEDTRVNHKTSPPTLWFIAETDIGRLLKVVFIELFDTSYEIKTE